MSPARAKGPGSITRCSGAVYTDCAIQVTGPRDTPQPVIPSEYSVSGAAAITIKYTGIGWLSRHCVRTLPLGSGARETSAPFATTVRPAGAVTVHVTVALSLGSSTLGIQCRARLGQLSPNPVQRPAL